MEDITDIDDIKLFVNDFYTKVQTDELLAPIFALRIANGKWDVHLNRMYVFWNTILFAQQGYSGNPFAKHLGLPLKKEHFTRWVSLFQATIDVHFEGEKANEAKWRAAQMGLLFSSKMEYFNKNPAAKPIL